VQYLAALQARRQASAPEIRQIANVKVESALELIRMHEASAHSGKREPAGRRAGAV
jgi:hypothetical protein